MTLWANFWPCCKNLMPFLLATGRAAGRGCRFYQIAFLLATFAMRSKARISGSLAYSIYK